MKKTSEQWFNEKYKDQGIFIYDPDGWDRSNYQYSWYEEEITLEEFTKRLMESTVWQGKVFDPKNG